MNALIVNILWDKTDLPANLQSSEIRMRTRVHELNDPRNRSLTTNTASVQIESMAFFHWLPQDFPNERDDMWTAYLPSGSCRVIGYDGKTYTVWWQRKYRSGLSWTDFEVDFHVRLFSY